MLEGWGDQVLSQIKEVSIDLSGNYRGLVRKVLPNADIMADRFHVMKLVNEELNRARNAEKKATDERLFRILYAGFAGLNEFLKLSALSYSP